MAATNKTVDYLLIRINGITKGAADRGELILPSKAGATFKTKEEAIEARKAANIKFGFRLNHGRS